MLPQTGLRNLETQSVYLDFNMLLLVYSRDGLTSDLLVIYGINNIEILAIALVTLSEGQEIILHGLSSSIIVRYADYDRVGVVPT